MPFKRQSRFLAFDQHIKTLDLTVSEPDEQLLCLAALGAGHAQDLTLKLRHSSQQFSSFQSPQVDTHVIPEGHEVLRPGQL
jgi:hypothetical protein